MKVRASRSLFLTAKHVVSSAAGTNWLWKKISSSGHGLHGVGASGRPLALILTEVELVSFFLSQAGMVY